MAKYSYDQVLAASLEYFNGDELAAKVFTDKYALQDENKKYDELTPDDMHRRLAKEFARIEAKYPDPMSETEIYELLKGYKYIVPQGSPMSGIGNKYQVQSLGNCFVIESPYDSYGGILKSDQELAQLMKRRAGVGLDISNIRPLGAKVNNAAKSSCGIAEYMERFSRTCREVAQCLSGETLILTSNGLIPIAKIKPGDKVWTQQSWVNVESVLKNKKRVVKLTTQFGKEIIASKDHIFHTVNGEKTIKDLKIGDPITQIIGQGWEGNSVKLQSSNYLRKGLNQSSRLRKDILFPEQINKDFSYLLGLWYGDGHVERPDGIPTSINVALADDWSEIKEKYIHCIYDLFNVSPTIKQKLNEKCSAGIVHSRELIKFLDDNQILKQKADEIKFPEILLGANSEVIFSFIAGFFDSDGCVQVSKKQYKINSINKQFLLTIQNIFAAHGIVSKLHCEIRNNKIGQEKWRDLYSLTINGEKSQTIFRQYMKESVKVKTKHFSSKKQDWTRSTLTIKYFNSKYTKHCLYSDDQFISRTTLDRINSDLNSNVETYLFQDYIKSISEETIDEIDVYDLVLDKEHLFFANGLYAHNSGRRGALIQTISVNHPEVDIFIDIKKDLTKVTGANISVRVTDEFMTAVKKDTDFTLRWPVDAKTPTITKVVKAREIWNKLIQNAWASAEPGILFWDTIIRQSPADIYAEKGFKTISTNPCGEIVLSVDSCRLLLINLLSFVKKPYTNQAQFDFTLFATTTIKAQKLMDDLIDLELEKMDQIISKVEQDPEPDDVKAIELNMWKKFKQNCINGRRTGLGITALGDCLAALGIKYGSEPSIEITEKIYKTLAVNAYKSTVLMAKDRGPFPIYEYELEKDHEFLQQIINSDPELKKNYKKYGRRNIALTTTAPTGSVSTQTQTTSGIEPAYLLSYIRRKKINPSDQHAQVDFVDALGDRWQEFTVYHHGVKNWMDVTGETDIKKSPYWGATSNEIDWKAAVRMQGVAQKWICHAISKTCNLPSDVSVEVVKDVYMAAYDAGCKGFTVYRDGCRTGVLVSEETHKKQNQAPETTALASDARPAQIPVVMAPKRPHELPCEIKKVKIQGEQWVIFVGLLDGAPYEIFGGLAKYIEIPNKCKIGKILKNGKNSDGITAYNLVVGEDDDQMLVKDIANVFENKNYGSFSRAISLSLRHGVPVQYVMEQLSKDKHSDITSFSRVIARVLKSYVKEGTLSTEKVCSECKKENSLIYQEGCLRCTNCGYSKC